MQIADKDFQQARNILSNTLKGMGKESLELEAARGIVSFEAANGLTDAIASLKTEISSSVDRVVTSNAKLQESNNTYAIVMALLTLALVFVGGCQNILSHKTLDFQQAQWRQQNQNDEIRGNCIRNGGTNCP